MEIHNIFDFHLNDFLVTEKSFQYIKSLDFMKVHRLIVQRFNEYDLYHHQV